MSYRDDVRSSLESSSARSKQNHQLNQLKGRCPALGEVADVDGLLARLRDPSCDVGWKTAALLSLVEEHQRDGRSGAFDLLLVAMFPALDRIYRTRVRGSREHDGLWGDILEGFTGVLDGYPVDRRRQRIAANIALDTLAALRHQRRAGIAENQLRAAAEPLLDELGLAELDGDADGGLALGDFATGADEEPAAPGEDELAAAELTAAAIFDAAKLSEADRLLVLGVVHQDRTLGELAADLGIGREAAKKRYQRAIARLRALPRCWRRPAMSPVDPFSTFPCGETSRHPAGDES